MGTDGYLGVKRGMLRSVIEKMVRHCGDPVLISRTLNVAT